MVNRERVVGLISLALMLACSREPTPIPECKGAVCGEVVESSGTGGTTATGAGGVAGQGGGMGGHGGGHGGHMGGEGGCAAPVIHIVQPVDGATVPHGPIDFEAHVECASPSADQIQWYVAGVDGVFATGFNHVTPINEIGSWELSVVIMVADSPVAEDVINFDTN